MGTEDRVQVPLQGKQILLYLKETSSLSLGLRSTTAPTSVVGKLRPYAILATKTSLLHVQKKTLAARGRVSSDGRHQLGSRQTSKRESERESTSDPLIPKTRRKGTGFCTHLEDKPQETKVSLEVQEFMFIINKWKMSVKKTGDFYKDKMIVALIG